LLEKSAGPQATVDTALATERALAAQIEGAKAQLKTPRSISLHGNPRPLTARSAAAALPKAMWYADTGTLATLVSQDPMYVIFPVSQRAVLDLAQPLCGKGVSMQSC